jgi:hypothetical protein
VIYRVEVMAMAMAMAMAMIMVTFSELASYTDAYIRTRIRMSVY